MLFSKLTKQNENNMSIEKKCNTKGQRIEEFFGEVCGRYGHESGLVSRQSKLTASKLAQGLILGSLKTPTANLNQFCQVLAQLEVSISESGLHERLNDKTVTFMQGLTAYALETWHDQQRIEIKLLQRFTGVRLVDSSQFKLPDALAGYFAGTTHKRAKASLKVTLCYEYVSGRFEALEMEAGKRPDQTNPVFKQDVMAGTLTIADLGFFNQDSFDQLHQQGAYFLSRLKLQAGIYDAPDSAKALTLLDILPHQVGARGECQVYLGSTKRVPVRLIYERLPEKIVAQRRRKAQAAAKKQRRTCSQWVLDLLAWSLYVTNVPPHLASADELRALYRLRWQIELVFKLWKSYAKLDVIGKWRLERVLCQFYARLLALLLFQWLAMSHRLTPSGELSLPKALQLLQNNADHLICAILQGSDYLDLVFHQIQQGFRRFALKQKRRKNPSTIDLLVQLSEH